jgi:hypothetical protein
MNAPSADEPNLQVATVVTVGEVMEGWKGESGTGITSPASDESSRDLPPLKLRRVPRPTRGCGQPA